MSQEQLRLQERILAAPSGWPFLLLFLSGLLIFTPFFFTKLPIVAVLLSVACLVGFVGLTIVNPNEARVLVLFGTYQGTLKSSGFFFVNPLYSKTVISLRVRTFETGYSNSPEKKNDAGQVVQSASRTRHLAKVNDKDGNPIEIAAVVMWKVVNTVDAMFQVDKYEEFVQVQSEAALRNLASQHPYDNADDHSLSLRGHTTAVGELLKTELGERLKQAGVEVLEARISYLAYAPEIAAAMLQRQQAAAIIAARQKIVEGAVGMVEMALARLAENKQVELDSAQKAAMVSNLLVVLCSERSTQPVVNTSAG